LVYHANPQKVKSNIFYLSIYFILLFFKLIINNKTQSKLWVLLFINFFYASIRYEGRVINNISDPSP